MAKTGFYSEQLKSEFCAGLTKAYGERVTRSDVLAYAKSLGYPPPYWFLNGKRSIGRGQYTTQPTPSRTAPSRMVPSLTPEMFNSNVASADTVSMTATVTPIHGTRRPNQAAVVDNLVPEKDPTYVEFGDFNRIEKIIQSKIFYPVFITGLSGNGKTLMIDQACAKLKRECIRVNLTEETDEDDLVGGNTLVDGNIVFREGPVLTAMRRGAVLILDEVDLNSVNVMCLQSILEGKPYHIKKTGEKVYPAVGFNIFATANTKGKGSDDGRFINTKIMNEAFLERFPVTFEQDFPPERTEVKILNKNMTKFGMQDDDFVSNLVKWANVIRKTFADGAANEVISTRRLVHIINAYAIFQDKMLSVQLCLNRFDDETKTSFIDLYTKIDGGVTTQDTPTDTPPQDAQGDDSLPNF